MGMTRTACWAPWVEEPDPDHPGSMRRSEFGMWVDNLSSGSELTGQEQARQLYRLLTSWGHTSPMEIVDEAKRDLRRVETLQFRWVAQMKARSNGKGQPYSEAYLNRHLDSLASWLKWNSITLTRRPKLDKDATPTLVDETAPTQDQLKTIRMAADLRPRLAVDFIGLAGIRPGALGTFRGTDGLRLSDLPELRIADGAVNFSSMPTPVRVRRELNKAPHPYLTFLPEEGCKDLKAYLETRLASGEQLVPQSPVLRVTRGWEEKRRGDGTKQHSAFMRTYGITDEIREVLKLVFPGRPYVLRNYFSQRLEGRVSREWLTYWMGHKGSMTARYATNRANLPAELVEQMREAYAKAQPWLCSEAPPMEPAAIEARIEAGIEAGMKKREEAFRSTLNGDMRDLLAKERQRTTETLVRAVAVLDEEARSGLLAALTVAEKHGLTIHDVQSNGTEVTAVLEAPEGSLPETVNAKLIGALCDAGNAVEMPDVKDARGKALLARALRDQGYEVEMVEADESGEA